jgi:hypothetical protein
MRWPFGRKSSRGDGPPAPAAIDADVPAGTARPDAAWRSLPAIQRAIGDPPVVAPAAPFAARLATRQPPPLALEVLGHEVSPLAAPGLLIGLASPTGAFNSGRVELPVQRAALGQPATLAEAPGWSSFDVPSGDQPTAVAAAADVAGQTGQPGSSPAGSQQSGPPAVQRSAARPVLTTSIATSVDVAPAGRLDLRPASATPPEGRARAAGPVDQQPAAHPVQRTPAIALPELPARRPTLGQARRLGLGAPLRSADGAAVQRSVQSGVIGLPAVGMPVLQTPPSSAARSDSEPGSIPPGTPAGSRLPADAKPDLRSAASPELTAGPTPDPTPELIQELTVVRPLSIQRLPASTRPEVQRHGADLPADGGPSWAPAVGPGAPATAAATGRPAPDDRPALPVSRLAADEPGDAVEADGREPTNEPIGATSPIGGWPIRASSADSLVRAPAPAADGVARSIPGPVRSISAGPVVARSIDDHGQPPGAVGGSTFAQLAGLGISVQRQPAGPLVQRTMAADGPPTEPARATVVSVQRAVQVNEVQVSVPSDGQGAPVPGSTGGASGPAPAAAPADRERELDELARRLYGRIRTRLAAELLADRERAGLLVDLR